MQDDWRIYEELRDAGASPHHVYWHGQRDGLQWFMLIRMMRSVFSLNLAEIKEIMVQAEGLAPSLSEYQAQLFPDLEQVLPQDDDSQG